MLKFEKAGKVWNRSGFDEMIQKEEGQIRKLDMRQTEIVERLDTIERKIDAGRV